MPVTKEMTSGPGKDQLNKRGVGRKGAKRPIITVPLWEEAVVLAMGERNKNPQLTQDDEST